MWICTPTHMGLELSMEGMCFNRLLSRKWSSFSVLEESWCQIRVTNNRRGGWPSEDVYAVRLQECLVATGSCGDNLTVGVIT